MGMTLRAQIVKEDPGGAAKTTIMDLSDVAEKVEITTHRMDTPGKMTFTCHIQPMTSFGI